jgi:hypothetical protein
MTECIPASSGSLAIEEPSYIPRSPPPGFEPSRVRDGTGTSGQRHIFGLSFSDKRMDYSEIELRSVQQLRDSAFDIDFLLESAGMEETQILRFIQGCEWKIEAATKALREYVDWKKGFSRHSEEAIVKGDDNEFMYWHGNDREYRPVLMVDCKRLNILRQSTNYAEKFMEESVTSCMNYFTDHLVRPGMVEQVLVIVDLAQCSIWDVPFDFIQKTARLLTSNYRARLNKLFVINAPYVFYGFWNVTKFVLPESTLAKFSIHREDYMPSILEYVDLSNIDPGIRPVA